MLQREKIIRELWRRFTLVDGIQYTARDPRDPPNVKQLPCVQFFELDDTVIKTSKRGASALPSYWRKLTVVAEMFILPQQEGSAGNELMDFVGKVKSQIYIDGDSLGRLCEIKETEASRVLRPPVAAYVIGMGIVFEITYVEDTAKT